MNGKRGGHTIGNPEGAEAERLPGSACGCFLCAADRGTVEVRSLDRQARRIGIFNYGRANVYCGGCDRKRFGTMMR